MAQEHANLELKCPKDGSHMTKVTAGGVTIDRCDGCGAMWFDLNELERMLMGKVKTKDIDVGARARTDARINTKHLDCPRDGSRMTEIEYPDQSHVHIMKCPTCQGMLLDAGELVDVDKFTLFERMKAFFS
ncbi:MAG TPA: zf-TFIIB domain-containing protein [Phycisphaerales bacterium]|nr:zf-TFIIB domain-containing protein [Phycisphaerales bacterium]